MKKTIDSLAKKGRKLERHVAFTKTHEIKLVFQCAISAKKEQMVAVREAEGIVAKTNGNIPHLADALTDLRLKYRHMGCVGYQIEKLNGSFAPAETLKNAGNA
ncbi:MAG: hypothetical protein ABIL58_15195 [Pseudomonadota bacterium]